MEKDMVFFSNDGNGLTSTSANHIANMAKEMIRSIEQDLASMKLYSTEVGLISSTERSQLVKGIDKEALALVPSKLRKIAQAKSLIAWLREAIKAKEQMLQETREISPLKYERISGKSFPILPRKSESLTKDEYLASLTADQRNRFYAQQTIAAVFGEAIHPKGVYAEARAQLIEKKSAPNEVCGEGRDTLIYSYNPSVEDKDVEDMYFDLQAIYRKAQAEVNAMQYELENTLEQSRAKVDAEYRIKLEQCNRERKHFEMEMYDYIQKRCAEIGDLRIIIPQALREIYETVANIGK